jgi:hypothetical protein
MWKTGEKAKPVSKKQMQEMFSKGLDQIGAERHACIVGEVQLMQMSREAMVCRVEDREFLCS